MVLYPRTLHNDDCENLKSYKKQLICCGAGLCYPQYVNGDGIRDSSNTYYYREASYKTLPFTIINDIFQIMTFMTN